MSNCAGDIRKKALRMSFREIASERKKLREKAVKVELTIEAKAEDLRNDTKGFFEQIFSFSPHKYQLELAEMFDKNQFTAVRWARQTGKSFIVSALLLKYALDHPESNIAIVEPSWRQTELNIRRIGGFCRKLPQKRGLSIQKTRISLPNGSLIEAFPNSPDTIRGPTFKVIWIEECNFISRDEELYEAIMFTLGTTNGKVIATSTPWNTDSLFWKMCNHKDYSDYMRSHVTWEDALESNGPLKQTIVEKIKRQFGDDKARWRREMEAEWAEDEDVWLPQSLIVASVGTVKNCGMDLQEFKSEQAYDGEFFGGLDLAQTRDYSVFAIIERLNDRLLLRHLKIFPQPTAYASVLGYLKMLQDRWSGFTKIRVDITREGPSFIKDMENAGIQNGEGVIFNVPRKSEMASLLKQRMANNKLFFPMMNWERPYKGDICNELNIERFDLRKDGAIGFSHPNGTHDDVFWSVALACFATADMQPFDIEALRFG